MADLDRETLPAGLPAGTGHGRVKSVEWAILTPCLLAWVAATISTVLLRANSGTHSLLCPVQTGCEGVLSSRYATILGVPLACFGLAFFASLLLILLIAYGTASRALRGRLLGWAHWLAVIGAIFSAMLMFIQFGMLHAFCPLCTASAVVAAGLVIALAKAEKLAAQADFSGHRAAAVALGVFALVSLAPHLISDKSTESDLLAVVDGHTFTRQEMEADLGEAYQTLKGSLYTLESNWVRTKVDEVLLAAATSRDKTPASDLLAARMAAVKPITEAEITARLASKGLSNKSETVSQIHDELLAEKRETARIEYLQELAKAHRIEILLKQPEPSALKIDLATSKISGPPDAKVQLVVFSDFQCHHCAELSSVLKKVRSDFPNDVMVAYRYFPLERHERAFAAAVAAECASEQGAFWDYHDRLYAQGGELSNPSLTSIASALGLDSNRFIECLQSGRARTKVEASRKDADLIGLQGVPALFLNGKRIGGLVGYEQLSKRIREALKRPAKGAQGVHQNDPPHEEKK